MGGKVGFRADSVWTLGRLKANKEKDDYNESYPSPKTDEGRKERMVCESMWLWSLVEAV
jgi:hypothetical protein